MAVALAIALSSCGVGEDLSGCPPREPNGAARMVVKVRDADDGDPIALRECIVDGTLLIFDSDRNLLMHKRVADADLGVEKAVPTLPATRADDDIWVAAWGNAVASSMTAENYTPGTNASASYLSLRDGSSAGVMRSLGDELFFGIHRLDPEFDELHEVWITQINSRLMVTVRGLGSLADCYFELSGNLSDALSMDGTPLNDDSRTIHQTGRRTEQGDLVTPTDWLLIPCVDQTHDRALLRLLQTADDRPIVETPIELLAGKTTNVLFDLTDSAPAVSIEITPWNELFLWNRI